MNLDKLNKLKNEPRQYQQGNCFLIYDKDFDWMIETIERYKAALEVVKLSKDKKGRNLALWKLRDLATEALKEPEKTLTK